MATTLDHRSRPIGWQPRPPLDPCRRLSQFGPIQPIEQRRSLLHRILFG